MGPQALPSSNQAEFERFDHVGSQTSFFSNMNNANLCPTPAPGIPWCAEMSNTGVDTGGHGGKTPDHMKAYVKSVLPAFLMVGFCRSVSAQAWVTTTDDYLTDEVGRAIQTRDGRFLAVADTGRALALIKRNSDGSLLWQRLLVGSPTGEAGRDVIELPDGRIVAVGDIYVNDHGNDDMALVIVSADARTVLRQRTYGGREGDDRALGLVPTRDGGYLLVGETLSWGTPGRRMLVVRVDADGDLEWAKVYRSNSEDDILYSGVELPGGEFLVVGSSGSVLRLDPGGALIWSRNYG